MYLYNNCENKQKNAVYPYKNEKIWFQIDNSEITFNNYRDLNIIKLSEKLMQLIRC